MLENCPADDRTGHILHYPSLILCLEVIFSHTVSHIVVSISRDSGNATSCWWFGTFFIFPYIGNFIIPTDFHIF